MWDVAVVGAGPAGAAAALSVLQRRPEARVLLLDKAAFPRDKACGDGIAPHAVDELVRLGVTGATNGYAAATRLRLRSPGGREVRGRPQRPNHVVPRVVFDARLVAAATARGATLERRRIRTVTDRGDHAVIDGDITARTVIGADGANSAVRRSLGIGRNAASALAVAMRGYAPAAASPFADDEMVITLVDEGWPAYWWWFPLGDGRANVGYGLLRQGLASRYDLQERLARLVAGPAADPATLRAHHLPLSTDRPEPGRNRILLAGDAASLINPVTGEGIYYAILSGRLAGAAALGSEPATRYRRLLGRALGRHLRHTTVAAALTHRWPAVAEGLVDASRRSRTVFDAMVELGLGRGTIHPATIGHLLRGGVTAGLVGVQARAGRSSGPPIR